MTTQHIDLFEGIMAEIDYYKGRIDFIKVMMTALFGMLLIIFWNVMAYPDIVKNMDFATKCFVLSFTFISIIILILGMYEWLKILNNLKDA